MSNNIEQKFADALLEILGYGGMAELIMWEIPSSSKDYKQIFKQYARINHNMDSLLTEAATHLGMPPEAAAKQLKFGLEDTMLKWIRGKKEISILAARPDFKRLLEKATQLAKQAKQFCHNQHADQLLDKWGKDGQKH